MVKIIEPASLTGLPVVNQPSNDNKTPVQVHREEQISLIRQGAFEGMLDFVRQYSTFDSIQNILSEMSSKISGVTDTLENANEIAVEGQQQQKIQDDADRETTIEENRATRAELLKRIGGAASTAITTIGEKTGGMIGGMMNMFKNFFGGGLGGGLGLGMAGGIRGMLGNMFKGGGIGGTIMKFTKIFGWPVAVATLLLNFDKFVSADEWNDITESLGRIMNNLSSFLQGPLQWIEDRLLALANVGVDDFVGSAQSIADLLDAIANPPEGKTVRESVLDWVKGEYKKASDDINSYGETLGNIYEYGLDHQRDKQEKTDMLRQEEPKDRWGLLPDPDPRNFPNPWERRDETSDISPKQPNPKNIEFANTFFDKETKETFLSLKSIKEYVKPVQKSISQNIEESRNTGSTDAGAAMGRFLSGESKTPSILKEVPQEENEIRDDNPSWIKTLLHGLGSTMWILPPDVTKMDSVAPSKTSIAPEQIYKETVNQRTAIISEDTRAKKDMEAELLKALMAQSGLVGMPSPQNNISSTTINSSQNITVPATPSGRSTPWAPNVGGIGVIP